MTLKGAADGLVHAVRLANQVAVDVGVGGCGGNHRPSVDGVVHLWLNVDLSCQCAPCTRIMRRVGGRCSVGEARAQVGPAGDGGALRGDRGEARRLGGELGVLGGARSLRRSTRS